MHTKELDMLIIQVEMELNLHKTHCHFVSSQLLVKFISQREKKNYHSVSFLPDVEEKIRKK